MRKEGLENQTLKEHTEVKRDKVTSSYRTKLMAEQELEELRK